MTRKIDVIIPTYKPDKTFEKLVHRLQKQTIKPDRILVINTEESFWEEAQFDKTPFVFGEMTGICMDLEHITVSEFNHGGTRRKAAEESDADYILFMTQDAMPYDRMLIENLITMLESDEMIGAAYARQLPAKDCNYIESYTRSFNYGDETRVKTKEDVQSLGIKTFFCSNVCAMYRRSVYRKAGGFPEHTIFNEDMICAGHMIQEGFKIAYVAEAKVIHSHNYNGKQQFKRNFDMAVSQVDFPEVFSAVKSESEGLRLVKTSAGYLCSQHKAYLLPKLIWISGCKYLGYRIGKSYKKLPKRLILKCTSNISYWDSIKQ